MVVLGPKRAGAHERGSASTVHTIEFVLPHDILYAPSPSSVTTTGGPEYLSSIARSQLAAMNKHSLMADLSSHSQRATDAVPQEEGPHLQPHASNSGCRCASQLSTCRIILQSCKYCQKFARDSIKYSALTSENSRCRSCLLDATATTAESKGLQSRYHLRPTSRGRCRDISF